MPSLIDFDKFFKKVVKRLQEEKISFAVAGGIAASLYRVEKRLTEDLDFLLLAQNQKQTIRLAKEIISSFDLKANVAREADLKGGPLFAIKNRKSEPYIIVGRDAKNKDRVGLDFILPAMPWFASALERAQLNQIDFGFGSIPTITPEDLLIAKVAALYGTKRYHKDLDDILSIFDAPNDIDLNYINAQLHQLRIAAPVELEKELPEILRKISKSVRTSLRS